ncbi:hypothetical protein OE88DRAFT_1405573 [Heliocybe sulcata]|uniref:Uncharacterized protein n=1 Tax=Heliocybe sulcata TaxID=5364 RepID=A0A5C3N5X7_9AGAM|nr:hypothetical protein OE88DRAFT_1405573 [Heliocybe sulcata]
MQVLCIQVLIQVLYILSPHRTCLGKTHPAMLGFPRHKPNPYRLCRMNAVAHLFPFSSERNSLGFFPCIPFRLLLSSCLANPSPRCHATLSLDPRPLRPMSHSNTSATHFIPYIINLSPITANDSLYPLIQTRHPRNAIPSILHCKYRSVRALILGQTFLRAQSDICVSASTGPSQSVFRMLMIDPKRLLAVQLSALPATGYP